MARATTLKLSSTEAVRLNIALAGVWWALFSGVTILFLKPSPALRRDAPKRLLTGAYKMLWKSLQRLRHSKVTVRFLVAFLFYSIGIDTVVSLSSQFGYEELRIPVPVLTLVILMVQFVALGGSLLAGRLVRRFTTKRVLLASLGIWAGTLIVVYRFLYTTRGFVIVASMIGLVLGGTQALSRSFFSEMVPRGREAEYFGFYEISGSSRLRKNPVC
jgi:MFS transporter, UMF1 family